MILLCLVSNEAEPRTAVIKFTANAKVFGALAAIDIGQVFAIVSNSDLKYRIV